MAITLPARSPAASGNRAPRAIRVPTAGDVRTVDPGVARDPGLSVSPEAFGAASGRALDVTGQELQETATQLTAADQRIRSRQDAVERARAISAFSETAATELRRLETEEDLSSPDVMSNFGGFLAQQQSRLLEEHVGSEESRLALEAQLESQRSKFSAQGAVKSVVAQRQLVAATLNNQLNPLISEASDAPDRLPELFDTWDAHIDNMAPGLTPEEEAARRDAGREQIALSAVESFLNRGAADEAERVLDTPGIVQVLQPETARRLKGRIIATRAEFEKERTAGLRKLRETEQIIGRELSGAERLRLAGLAPPQSTRQSLPEKVAEFETVVGRAATQDEIAKMAGADVAGEGGVFGKGLTGRALDIMTDGAATFAAGLMTEEEERRFISAVTQFRQPTTFPNPDTGLIETRRPALPPFVEDAFARRGMPLPGTEERAARAPVAAGETAPAAAPEAEPVGATPTQGQTIWDLAGLATGPIPSAAEALSQTPLVGQIVRAPRITQARTFIPLLQRDLVRVLQNNPRYAEGERTAIEQEINISPRFFDDPNAFRDRLVAVDDALQVRLNNALKTAQSNAVGRDERVQAMNVANGIVQFRESLGVPPRVQTPDEARKLPPGSLFIDPEGNVRQVPAEGAAPEGGE